MANVWSNTSVFIKEEEINWNINDFALLWNASGGKEMYSPDFHIGDNIYTLLILKMGKGRTISVNGVLVEPSDKLVVIVTLMSLTKNALTGDPSPLTWKDKRFPVYSEILRNGSAENADFSIECGGKVFPCHEFILRARSSVLNAMFQNEMTESSARSMTVVDVGSNAMAAFLEYLYTGEITVEVDMKELIYVADKYNLEGLMELCFRKLPEVEDHVVVDFLFMADKHNFIEFKKEAMIRINMNKTKYMEDKHFVEKLQEVPRLLLELYKL